LQNRKGAAAPLVIGILVLIIAGAGFYFASRDNAGVIQEMQDQKMDQGVVMTEENGAAMQEKMAGEAVKVFKLTAMNYQFSEKEMRVKKGDKVRIELDGAQGFHDWMVDEFNARTTRVSAGQSAAVEFVADKAGTFEYYCGVGNHRQLGMVGSLIVEDSEGSGGEAMMPKEAVSYSGEVLAGNVAPLLDFNQADYDKALASDNLVVLYFYANWCPICRVEVASALYPAFNDLETDQVVGLRVNYNDSDTDDSERQLAREFGVAYQHTKVFLKDGERILKSPESWSKGRYLNEINQALSN